MYKESGGRGGGEIIQSIGETQRDRSDDAQTKRESEIISYASKASLAQ